MCTYSQSGESEPGLAFFQVKAADRLPVLRGGTTISWPASRRDLKLWLSEAYPVVLVVYDGQREKAYWLHVQEYFASRTTSDLFTVGETINVHIPLRSRINLHAVEQIAQRKREMNQRMKRVERRP
jgi:hypothetical protein